MSEITTDCKTEEGITVGLIDAIISICRVLKSRKLDDFAIKETLKDLASDKDFIWLCNEAKDTL